MVDTLYLKLCILLSNDFSLTSEDEAYWDIFVSPLSRNRWRMRFQCILYCLGGKPIFKDNDSVGKKDISDIPFLKKLI